MRSDHLRQLLIPLVAVVLMARALVGCQPRQDAATDRVTRTPPSPPTLDHHPPRRMPEN